MTLVRGRRCWSRLRVHRILGVVGVGEGLAYAAGDWQVVVAEHVAEARADRLPPVRVGELALARCENCVSATSPQIPNGSSFRCAASVNAWSLSWRRGNPPFTCSTMPQPTVSRSVWNVRARLAAMPSRKYVQRRRGIGLKPQTQRMRGRRIVNHLAWGTPWCGTGWPLRRETGQRRAALCGQVIPSACACALQPHSLPDRCKQVIQRLVESTCKE